MVVFLCDWVLFNIYATFETRELQRTADSGDKPQLNITNKKQSTNPHQTYSPVSNHDGCGLVGGSDAGFRVVLDSPRGGVTDVINAWPLLEPLRTAHPVGAHATMARTHTLCARVRVRVRVCERTEG